MSTDSDSAVSSVDNFVAGLIPPLGALIRADPLHIEHHPPAGPPVDVRLDTDAQAAHAAEWRRYADEIEAYGRPRDDFNLETFLGVAAWVASANIPYIAAKAAEADARAAAYKRLADRARRHADLLDHTRGSLAQCDDDAAAAMMTITQGLDQLGGPRPALPTR
ncbi:MAG TPA: hypothetical protein VMU34_01895 [Mycobacterium sp.]|nr:hypothetical protein [Mycobacterium sp.]